MGGREEDMNLTLESTLGNATRLTLFSGDATWSDVSIHSNQVVLQRFSCIFSAFQRQAVSFSEKRHLPYAETR